MQAHAGKDMSAANALLREQFSKPGNDARTVQALLTMHLTGAIEEKFLLQQLSHDNDHVRAWSVRLLTETWPIDDALGPAWRTAAEAARIESEAQALLPALKRLAREDRSAVVRLTLASTLQRLPVQLRTSLAADLVTRAEDAVDHNIPMMIWYGLIPTVGDHANDLVDVARACKLPETLQYISRCLAEEIEKQPQPIDRLLALVAESQDAMFQQTVLVGVSEGFQGWLRAPNPPRGTPSRSSEMAT